MSKSDDDTAHDPVDDRSETVLTLEDPAEVTADETDEVETEVADSESSRRPKRRVLAALAALVAIAAAAALVVLSISEYRHRQDDALRAQAVQTSRDYLVAMAAFDYQKMDANRDHIVANSTPGFAAKYDEMVKALRDIVVTSKGVATATADRVVTDTLDDDTATVIAFVDQHVTNVTAPQGSNQKYRMVVKLVRSGDRWIVDDVQTV
ncbi:mce associated protein mas1a [Mycolicibacterium sp. 050232]|uniref:mce associated protein mas1a n=1 Tax=Mycolicibacterium sp. 050232 TaxID=3113982 RepID=UPI002E2D8865|nr:mce associated protein mas1a [Mycolicibacterium sp. 050232]MED5815181.1 mce associated protein mas1a [Mycolicibacterium sp. 050232]